MQFDRIYPQGPVAPITSTQRKDERTAEEIKDLGHLNAQQSVVVLGDTVPIVFCAAAATGGGVWMAPPAVRWGFNNAAVTSVDSCFALSLGEGPLGAAPTASAVYKGSKNSSDISLRVSTTNGHIGSLCSLSINVKEGYLRRNETSVVTGSAGIPTVGGPPSLVGKGELTFTSRDTCESITESIGGSYVLQGQGNGVTGYPDAIIDAKHSTKEKLSYHHLVATSYASNTLQPIVTWERRLTYAPNPDRVGLNAITIRYFNPKRPAGFPYPSNIPLPTGSVDQDDIDKLLDNANANAQIRAEQLPVDPYQVADRADRIGSGSTLAVVLDAYKLTVTEHYREYYPVPSVPTTSGSGGTFAGLAILNVSATTALEANEHLNQVYVYLAQGVQVQKLLGGTGASGLLPDLFMHLLQRNSLLPASLIDTDRLTAAAQFVQAEGMFYSGILASAVNFREYFQAVAPHFLLSFTQYRGKLGLRPLLPVDAANKVALVRTTISHAFTSADVVAGTLQRTYRSLEERKPFCALMVWRDQPVNAPGVQRVTEVRYSGSAVDGPYEQYDLSEYCISEAHAVKIGRYLLARRRHSTHTVSFQALPSSTAYALSPGDWVTVNADGVNETYRIEAVDDGPDGTISIAAEHFPVDDNGVSLMSKDILAVTGYSVS